MTIEGILELRDLYAGSKSDGTYPILIANGMEYQLGRQDVLPTDDDFFFPFNGKHVSVEGDVRGEYITVLTVTVTDDSVTDDSVTTDCVPDDQAAPDAPSATDCDTEVMLCPEKKSEKEEEENENGEKVEIEEEKTEENNDE